MANVFVSCLKWPRFLTSPPATNLIVCYHAFTHSANIDGVVFACISIPPQNLYFDYKEKPLGDSVLIMNKFLFMSPGYKGTSRLSLGRENGLNSPVRNLGGSKYTERLLYYLCSFTAILKSPERCYFGL